MTVENVDSEVIFVGNAVTTSFPFVFRVDDIDWLSVDFTDDFSSFQLNGDQDESPGGSIEYSVAPPDGQSIVLTRTTPLTQALDYTRHGPFDSESHENALDKLTMAIQDLKHTIARKSKAITIELPANGDDLTMFYTPVAITVMEILAVVDGSAPSVDWTIKHDPDRSAAGNEIVTGGTTTTNETVGDNITVFDDPTIPADSWVWLSIPTITGLVERFHTTIVYSED